MQRRDFFRLAALAAAGSGLAGCSGSASEALPDSPFINAALQRFRALPGQPAYSIIIGEGKNSSHNNLLSLNYFSDVELFIGSAFKTFIITKALQDIEAGLLLKNQEITIDDTIRVNDAPLFINLQGSAQIGMILDAIALYSDNIGADAAMKQVGPDRVRAFLASAGLSKTRIPDSVRIFESYVAGAPLGVDIGWDGIQKLQQGIFPGTPRPAINDEVSIVSTARELASYYRKAMRGDFFTKAITVTQFKNIHALGNLDTAALPDTAIYAKEGDGVWLGLHSRAYAGQMILCSAIPITFAFIVNWTDESTAPTISDEFDAIIGDVLNAFKKMYG